MAAGVPYVNSDIPPTREITDGGKGGILYKPKNERQLAEEIVKLLKNEKLYKSKVKEGKEFVKKYDWSEVVKQTGAIYKKSVQKA
jgi:glycosyltransferase involved in cell wall biosynthesis